MSLFRSFLTISGFTLLSRILGFIRDILFAAIMGAGPLTEAFLVAFKLPNFFRRIFGEGAFNAAFVPMFSHKLAADGKEASLSFAQQVFSVLLCTLLIFIIIMEITMPMVMYGLAPGFVGDEQKFDLAVALTRITFPYLLFVSLVSLLAGMQNSVQRFAASASSPILLNLCLITGLYFHEYFAPTVAHAAAISVCIGGVLQFLWLLIACIRDKQKIKLVRPRLTPDVRQFIKKMIPGIIGAGVMQINLWVDLIIATFIPGAIAYLYYADRINQLPLSIIGIALGTALLPMLSKHHKLGKKQEAINSQNRALEMALFMTLPSAVAFVIIAEPIISVLFERGEFTSANSLATSYGLIAYAIGLPAFVMVKVFVPSFFAKGDTKTPVKIAVYALIANVIMNICFVLLFKKLGYLPHIGLALATSISSWLNFTMLVIILVRNGDFYLDKIAKKKIIRISISTLFMAIGLFLISDFVEKSISGLIILIVVGKIIYITSAFITKAITLDDIKKVRRG